MNKQAVKSLVPELRFPEFQDQDVWKIVFLSDISDVKGGKRIPKGYSLTEENTGLPYIRITDMYMGGVDSSSVLFITEEIEQQIKNYKISKSNLFITVAGTIGIVGEIPDELDNANLTENANKIVVKNVNKKYLLQYLSSDQLQNKIKSSITNNAQPKLSLERIRGFSIPFPMPEEQQKIADCLSSLDELVSAHSQKLDALKAHKKGLMQNLFPAEGETIPKLRFPEFKGGDKWKQKALGNAEVSTFVKERVTLEQLKLSSYVSTENIQANYAGIAKASKLPPSGSFTSYKPNDVLISNIRPYLKKVWSADKNGAASNDVIVIRPSNKVSSTYLLHILKNDEFINFVMKGAKGVKMPRGDIASIQAYPVALPKNNEQQKIADCLSSLDELITAQSQKIETLKIHKKGLMQQLFPAMDEVGK